MEGRGLGVGGREQRGMGARIGERAVAGVGGEIGHGLSVPSAPGAGSSDRLRDVRHDALVGPGTG